MAKELRIKIVVIAEDIRLQDYMVMLLVGEGYEVKPFSSQSEALSHLDKETPDLIISEFHTPNINGLDLCKLLRKNIQYNFIPIFFIIHDSEPLNAARLIYAGADDYIKKSSIEDELFLKVKLNLYRILRQKQDINNLTKLPARNALLKELQSRIEMKELFAVHFVEIVGLEQFGYRYGFQAQEEVVKLTGSLIFKTLRETGDIADFICHYQINQFILLTMAEHTDAIASKIIREFDNSIAAFHTQEELKEGCISVKTRFGETRKEPLLRLIVAAATNSYFPLFTPMRIIEIASEIKKSAPVSDKSTFIKEERKNYPIS